MASVSIDMTGQRYGRLVALYRAEDRIRQAERKVYWRFRCDCGTEKDIEAVWVRRGRTVSCGCKRGQTNG